jgi:hypothetical protein
MAINGFSPRLDLRLVGAASKAVSGSGRLGFQLAHAANLSFLFGSGAGRVDQFVTQTRTLAGGAAENLDLAGGLTNPFGETVAFARVKAIVVELLADTTASSITVGGAVSNQWADGPAARITNGGILLLAVTDATALAVTAGTGDLFRVVNDDPTNTATYRISLIGNTA